MGSENPAPRKVPWGKLAVGLLAVLGIVVLFRLLPVGEWLKEFQAWVKQLGFFGYVLYALLYAGCTVLFVPGSVLTLGAGAIYGLWVGTLVVLAGANLGALLAFLLARTLLRNRVEKMTSNNAKFRALDRAIGKEGGKIVFLVRLAPIFPFNFINYAFGLTGVSTLAYVLASLVGMIPGTFAYVYLGAAGAAVAQAAHASSSSDAGHTRLIVNIVGAAAALIVTIFVARLANNAIKKAGVEE